MHSSKDVWHDHEATARLSSQGCDRMLDVTVIARRGFNGLYRKCAGGRLEMLEIISGEGGCLRVVKQCNSCDAGHEHFEQLDPFRDQGYLEIGKASDIAAWTGQAGDNARRDRIADLDEYDRNRTRLLLRSDGCRCGMGDN